MNTYTHNLSTLRPTNFMTKYTTKATTGEYGIGVENAALTRIRLTNIIADTFRACVIDLFYVLTGHSEYIPRKATPSSTFNTFFRNMAQLSH